MSTIHRLPTVLLAPHVDDLLLISKKQGALEEHETAEAEDFLDKLTEYIPFFEDVKMANLVAQIVPESVKDGDIIWLEAGVSHVWGIYVYKQGRLLGLSRLQKVEALEELEPAEQTYCLPEELVVFRDIVPDQWDVKLNLFQLGYPAFQIDLAAAVLNPSKMISFNIVPGGDGRRGLKWAKVSTISSGMVHVIPATYNGTTYYLSIGMEAKTRKDVEQALQKVHWASLLKNSLNILEKMVVGQKADNIPNFVILDAFKEKADAAYLRCLYLHGYTSGSDAENASSLKLEYRPGVDKNEESEESDADDEASEASDASEEDEDDLLDHVELSDNESDSPKAKPAAAGAGASKARGRGRAPTVDSEADLVLSEHEDEW